jgi:hypothetical protein
MPWISGSCIAFAWVRHNILWVEMQTPHKQPSMETTRINSWQIKDNSNSRKKTWQQREVRANCIIIRLVSEQRLLQEKDWQTCFSFRSSALMSPLVTLLICSLHLPTWSWKLVIASYCGRHPDKMDCNKIRRNSNQWPHSQSQQIKQPASPSI